MITVVNHLLNGVTHEITLNFDLEGESNWKVRFLEEHYNANTRTRVVFYDGYDNGTGGNDFSLVFKKQHANDNINRDINGAEQIVFVYGDHKGRNGTATRNYSQHTIIDKH